MKPASERLQKVLLIILVLGISVLFLMMIRRFLVTLILAAVFAAMATPAFLSLRKSLGDRPRVAALISVLGLLLLILIPIGAFLTLVVTQAIDVSDLAEPWIRTQAERWPEVWAWLRGLPLIGDLVPDRGNFGERAGDLVSRGGALLVDSLRAATTGTANLVVQLFLLLYAFYFFLTDGPNILARMLALSPLGDEAERQLIERFVSVTRATIKGSLLVGLLQGALAGAAFFVLGIPGAAFWSTVMAILSVIPLLGSVIVWGPAAIILMASGQVGAGAGLALWGTLVVSSIDNFIRPRLVGRDTRMHDLLVLLSTFGGLAMFGLAGFIVGPIVAALFVTAWDLYGAAFREILPPPPTWVGNQAEEDGGGVD